MRIKRFEAPDTRTAIAMVKQEMGEDAVILTSKTVGAGNGPKKSGGKARVEVVAAVDYDPEAIYFSSSAQSAPAAPKITSGKQADTGRSPSSRQRSFPHSLAPSPPPAPQSFPKKADPEIKSEARDIRTHFATLLKDHRGPRNGASVPSGARPPKYRPVLRKPDHNEVARWRDRLINRIESKPLSIDSLTEGPAVITLVGTTGVGKTVSAAKIASWHGLREGWKTVLVSADCYRIGATDQLRTYARVMRLPCEISLRKRDLERIIARHWDKDLIIIDTAGKGPYDENHLAELKDWFASLANIQTLLVLSATTQKNDLANTIKAYKKLGLNGLILTKLDETRSYAGLCQQVVESSLPVSYLCTGQCVPADFLPATKNVIDKIFRQGCPAVAPDLKAAHNEIHMRDNVGINL